LTDGHLEITTEEQQRADCGQNNRNLHDIEGNLLPRQSNSHDIVASRVKRFYDDLWTRYTPAYDSCCEHVELFFSDAEIEGKRILDAGCGMGVFSVVFGKKGAARVIGIDLSEEGVRRAQRAASHFNLSNVEFREGNILRLPYPDGSFDIVWSWGTLHHTAEPLKALEELIRVLKNGGTLFVTLYRSTKLSFLHEGIRKTLRLAHRRMWPLLAKLIALALFPATLFLKRRKKARAGENLSDLVLDWYFNPVRHYYRPGEIRQLLEQEGLIIEKFLPASGRFNSTSNFIFKAKLVGDTPSTSKQENSTAPENRIPEKGCP